MKKARKVYSRSQKAAASHNDSSDDFKPVKKKTSKFVSSTSSPEFSPPAGASAAVASISSDSSFESFGRQRTTGKGAKDAAFDKLFEGATDKSKPKKQSPIFDSSGETSFLRLLLTK